MKIVISRSYGVKQTTSCLYVFNGDSSLFNCKMLELPYLKNKRNVSCIMEGIYDAKKIIRPNGDPAILLLNVPGRSMIEIHVGNYASFKLKTPVRSMMQRLKSIFSLRSEVDTQGCLLPGLQFYDINKDGNLDVQDSGKAMGILLTLLPDTFKIYII